jgi:predicted DNA-binding protein (MmcQ/YjbR family)
MNYEELCKYLLRHPGTVKEHLLESDTPAFKVKDKVFAMIPWQNNPLQITLKLKALRGKFFLSQYTSITPGNIANNTQWISIPLDNTIPLPVLLDIIDESYELALRSIKKSIRDKLQLEIS